MDGGWSFLLKLISVSAPLKNSGMDGGAIAAKFTCRVRSFCSLFEGLPGWIMYICRVERDIVAPLPAGLLGWPLPCYYLLKAVLVAQEVA